MHYLSNRLTGLFLYFIFPAMIAESFYVTITAEPFAPGLIAFPVIAALFFFFYFRKVRIIWYDSNAVYVRNFFKVEKIPMGEVAAVNIPDSYGDITYELEFRSRPTVEFIPTFIVAGFVWEKPGVPANVRRFQTILANFEAKEAS